MTAVSQWIDVKEKLPEQYERVFAFRKMVDAQ